ncbi:MAG: beta-ketoacyl-[acyl-carrier-protein] synthase family protein [Sphingobacterium sp.]|uniref:beta-ketoacyl-[acyl-carrier-protein] synthase family protein n=1 Tax=Sphingobacterium sp. JB170 TaxID=1434842 RepID=UPI00097E77D0|nr:beta-ketoacyl-[acyl-carrier-protein] synthase family protein [Sphingobacterium sp. JB170]SJN44327.1 3-oxoacyl-[acyl-carrier-protein] synthase, KASII [Sphingobacterium sp. JB170]
MSKPKVAVTGMGIVSAIGLTVEENLYALLNGRHGVSRLENFSSKWNSDIFVGEIKYTNEQLTGMLALDPGKPYTRTTLLGIYAARQAIRSAGLKDLSGSRTGLISATSVGGMDYTERYFYDYLTDPSLRPYITTHDAGDSSQQIAHDLGINGLVTTISTACSSAANAIMMGARLIASGRLDRVIVGGTDALSKFTINGFNTLMILSDERCRPFDNERKGLNLGEAAAYLILESEESVNAEQKEVLAYLAGYGNANDAFHQTASSADGQGAYLAIGKALKSAGVEASFVDYINVHGTGTVNNDLSEGHALLRTFGEDVPLFSSTKGFTGHTLAAAAAIEAVYSILAIRHDKVFANLNFQHPMQEFSFVPQSTVLQRSIACVLSNSFGFGGNCSTLIFTEQ